MLVRGAHCSASLATWAPLLQPVSESETGGMSRAKRERVSCPYCGHRFSDVTHTDGVFRRRKCENCKRCFRTREILHLTKRATSSSRHVESPS